MKTGRILLSLALASVLVSSCGGGYRRGPSVYTGVAVGSPWYGYPGYGYGYPVYVGDGGPDVDLPPEHLPSPPPEAVPLPSMGMPDAGFDGGGFDGGGFDGGF